MSQKAAHTARKPAWLRVRLPTGEALARFEAQRERMRRLQLSTVCEEARCPNAFECWGAGTATIMILGETCTRGCRFCSVRTGDPGGYTDPREPEHTARAVEEMGLAYVVLTMVDRDDLLDGGAAHVARTVRAVAARNPGTRVEVLTGDFQGVRRDVETVVVEGRPDVFAHNVEVVPRLQRQMRDARCSWERSVQVLRWAKDAGARFTKSSLMVGVGEEPEEVVDAMAALREAGVELLTIGQYLRPTPRHAEVRRWVHPEEFARYQEAGRRMGFRFVAAGPLVRSSYRAAEAFALRALREGEPAARHDRYGRHLPPSASSGSPA